ncbi:MAG: saccharopine dehydrogenase C-terminal domain-containing protein [Anaerolineales bacterium]|jgi:saccharopine dehydrogenase-like NADP-dependent oxidoreductase
MKILVFGGSGKMGAAVAWDLVKEDDVEQVGLVGRRLEALERAKDWIGSPKVVSHALDIADMEATKELMGGYDVGVITLPDRRTSYKVVDAAIDAGLNVVDMLEEFHRRPDKYEIEGLEIPEGMTLDEYGESLHERAVKNGVTFLDGIGFAPGISNITVGEGIRKLDKAESAVARVGGIPSKEAAARHPLRYMITWAFEHVLREYMLKVEVIKDGKVVEVDAATDLEPFRFSRLGKDEDLECAITPGMPSFVFTRPELQEFAEKTVRWPGHWGGVMTLKECGMLDLEPVEVDGQKIVPREVLLAAITPRLLPREGDTDVCVMWNSVKGIKDGRKMQIDYYMWDEADTKNDISSMARVTGFSAAIGALFIGRGLITTKGIVPPEDCFDGERYDLFIEELNKRDIIVLEESAFVD